MRYLHKIMKFIQNITHTDGSTLCKKLTASGLVYFSTLSTTYYTSTPLYRPCYVTELIYLYLSPEIQQMKLNFFIESIQQKKKSKTNESKNESTIREISK